MKFANPLFLNLLWVLFPVFGIMVYGLLQRKKILNKFATAQIFSSLSPGFDPKTGWIKTGLMITAFALAVVALSGPQWGYRWEKTRQRGVDIMIALDCSRSMLARDIKPSRLEQAKREIIDLLKMMKSDRAGLVAFSGKAILQCPLTLDYSAFNIFLKVLEPGFMPVGGTNLSAALKACYNGFEKESDTQKAIILITDGENTSGSVEDAAKEMAKHGIKIFGIGVGDIEGTPIPDEKGGFKKDASGNIILSKVDEKGLENLSAITGGLYVRSVAGDMDLDLIYKDKIVGTMERKILESGKKKVWENRYQWFLFPCLVLLLVELFLSAKRKLKTVSIIIFALAVTLFSSQNSQVHAKSVSSSVKQGIKAFNEQKYEKAKKHFIDAQLENPENEKLYFNIGAAAYMNKEYELAEKNFIQAQKSDDIKLSHDAQYNLANTQYRLGNLDEAIKGYKDILKNFPNDVQAEENLEFVKQKKQEQKKQKKQNSKSNQDKKENRERQEPENREKQKENKQQSQNKKQKKNEQKKNREENKNRSENKKQSQQDKQDQSQKKPLNSKADKKQQPEKTKPKDPNMENMLNRLQDKPGRAMMPVIQEKHVEKDW